ncbi:hypothetical protein NBRC116188_29560 [Oceaniserpentilla sp. 4NH20-0058]|uniref:hypothetical protein n=1 Tax=Oceaniserpentilla sp. 4NH20-0058 TaxID=3127660 RepID=UPI0031043CA8
MNFDDVYKLIDLLIPVLGPILGGVLGYLTATFSARMANKQKILEFKLNLLKEASINFHSFDSLLFKYLLTCSSYYNEYENIQNPLTDEEEQEKNDFLDEIYTMQTQLFDKNSELQLFEAKLSLAGAVGIKSHLDDYYEWIRYISKIENAGKPEAQDERQKLVEKIQKGITDTISQL